MGVVTFKLEGTCPEIAGRVFFPLLLSLQTVLQHIKLQYLYGEIMYDYDSCPKMLTLMLSKCHLEWGKFSFFFFSLQGLDHSAVGLNLVSNIIKDELGLPEVSVLMGANLAKEVAREMFGEATIGKEFVFIFWINSPLSTMGWNPNPI